jgi:hypothetical protein
MKVPHAWNKNELQAIAAAGNNYGNDSDGNGDEQSSAFGKEDDAEAIECSLIVLLPTISCRRRRRPQRWLSPAKRLRWASWERGANLSLVTIGKRFGPSMVRNIFLVLEACSRRGSGFASTGSEA